MKSAIRLLFIVCYFANVFFISSCSQTKDPLPKELYTLVLIQRLSGSEAKEYINKLHFQPVTETENEIGFYKGEKGEAIIYVTHYKNSTNPKVDYEKMTKKISPENSVFIYPSFFELNSKKIYKCFGMGMTHYVFYHDYELFWISVDTHISELFLSEYLNILNNN